MDGWVVGRLDGRWMSHLMRKLRRSSVYTICIKQANNTCSAYVYKVNNRFVFLPISSVSHNFSKLIWKTISFGSFGVFFYLQLRILMRNSKIYIHICTLAFTWLAFNLFPSLSLSLINNNLISFTSYKDGYIL